MNTTIAYKLVTTQNWKNFLRTQSNLFYGFDNDMKNGFIHLTKKENIPIVMNKKFSNETNMTMLTIDLESVENLKWENDYPHIYGPIMMNKDVLYAEPYNILTTYIL